MSDTFNIRTEIGKIVDLLPREQALHMRRVGVLVGVLTALFCGPCGCAGSYRHYGEAASYHDIGKVCVPRSILTKPGKLLKDETVIIRRHPLYAKMVFDRVEAGHISGIPKYLIRPALDSALYHHEWWNGSGYPYGKKYDAIPLIAQITAVCDSYDAMTSNRIYRTQHKHSFACGELEKYAGKQFNPQIVRAFLDNERELAAWEISMIASL